MHFKRVNTNPVLEIFFPHILQSLFFSSFFRELWVGQRNSKLLYILTYDKHFFQRRWGWMSPLTTTISNINTPNIYSQKHKDPQL